MSKKTLEELLAENEDRTVEEVKALFAAAVAENNSAITTKTATMETAREAYLSAYTSLLKERNAAFALRSQYRSLLPSGSYDPNDPHEYSPLNDIAITSIPDYAIDYHLTGGIDFYYDFARETTLPDPKLIAMRTVISKGEYSSLVANL